MSASETPRVDDALTALAREHAPRVLALLARSLNDVDLADEAVQDALVDATKSWPTKGIPANPGGWLMAVARGRAVDRFRSEAAAARRLRQHARSAPGHDDPPAETPNTSLSTSDYDDMPDERLRLIFLCCHPALDVDSQVALTLRLIGGLTTPEIASSFLLPEATLAQRIVRAKRKIKLANIPLHLPSNPRQRLGAVLAVIYLIFNEGYLSHANETGLRLNLLEESARLVALLQELVPDDAEIEGLRAMQLFAVARLSTRFDRDGELVLLADQDRSRWDLTTIRQANEVLTSAMSKMQPGPYQLQALIASYHANAPVAGDTNWTMIASLYAQLDAMTGSPVVRLNRAVAVAMADGPGAGLALLDTIVGLHAYHLFHASRAELLLLAGFPTAARDAFDTAHSLATNPVERRHLQRRLDTLERRL